MSFLSNLRVGGAHDPLRRPRSRATTLRSQRVRRAMAAIAAIVTAGAMLLTLPGNASSVKPADGQAIAIWTQWVRHRVHLTYVDLAHQAKRGAALARHRGQLTASDFNAARADIRAKVAADKATLAHAKSILATLASTRDDWFHLYGGAATSPILGPAKMTAADMAAYAVSMGGRHIRTTVPILDVARMFLEEGAVEGVRGDVAFAQAIKETGDFSSADVLLNNFAGLGHCSACGHGDPFKTAREGVRAQIELLRWLADPTVHALADLASQPATLPVQFTHNGHSRATWESLGGLWAPNPKYGDSIYDLYMRMYSFGVSRWGSLHR